MFGKAPHKSYCFGLLVKICMRLCQDGMHLKYQHDGSQESGDEFTLLITDGVHRVEKVSHVKIMPLKDEQPQVTKNAGLKVLIHFLQFSLELYVPALRGIGQHQSDNKTLSKMFLTDSVKILRDSSSKR